MKNIIIDIVVSIGLMLISIGMIYYGFTAVEGDAALGMIICAPVIFGFGFSNLGQMNYEEGVD